MPKQPNAHQQPPPRMPVEPAKPQNKSPLRKSGSLDSLDSPSKLADPDPLAGATRAPPPGMSAYQRVSMNGKSSSDLANRSQAQVYSLQSLCITCTGAKAHF